MPKTFLRRSTRTVLISLASSLCLFAAAQAQHGGGGGGHGGGGHLGGGYFGGGHSSHAHASAGHTGGHHWGWLHFWSQSRERDIPRNVANEFPPAEMFRSRNLLHRLPSTYIRTVPLRSTLFSSPERFSPYRFRRHPGFFPYGFRRFPGSGCFFDGFDQVCFFEPAWPLLWFSAGFDWFPFDWEFADANGDTSSAIDSGDMMAAPPTDSEAEEPPNNDAVAAQPIRGRDLDARFFLLILKNGAERVVTDYWVSDGYIEYVSGDGSRSHIPVGALDLEETVRNNAARGLSFVLRSAP